MRYEQMITMYTDLLARMNKSRSKAQARGEGYQVTHLNGSIQMLEMVIADLKQMEAEA